MPSAPVQPRTRARVLQPVRPAVAEAVGAAEEHVGETTDRDRKGRGQFFTPAPVARFMAGLFERIPPEARLLDAGAGCGVLTAAVCDRVAAAREPHALEAVLFETDADAVCRLRRTLDACRAVLTECGHEFRAVVRADDFAHAAANRADASLPLFEEAPPTGRFDLAILNPPYFKLRADSAHAEAARRIGPSQPNAYSLFLAAAVHQLKPGGELVAITPRSFCNGRYFREFRRWLLDRADLLQVHAFGSRTAAFREAGVLQENVITHFRRRGPGRPRASVIVSRSAGRDFADVERERLPRGRVVDGSCGDHLICVPERSEDAGVVELAENWPGRFADTGLRISTGPVVMFRTREHHREEFAADAVPLLTSHHVRGGGVEWPRPRAKWPTAFAGDEAADKHLIPAQNYVLLKRFSAKEERRRLSAGVLLPGQLPTDCVAVENHLNYVTHRDRELTAEEAVGTAAVFNSALLDRYFRSFSGNTQVNATEIRTMKFPDLDALRGLGRALLADPVADPEAVVLDRLGVAGPLRAYLEGFAR